MHKLEKKEHIEEETTEQEFQIRKKIKIASYPNP
jgi:hypothetical protein